MLKKQQKKRVCKILNLVQSINIRYYLKNDQMLQFRLNHGYCNKTNLIFSQNNKKKTMIKILLLYDKHYYLLKLKQGFLKLFIKSPPCFNTLIFLLAKNFVFEM